METIIRNPQFLSIWPPLSDASSNPDAKLYALKNGYIEWQFIDSKHYHTFSWFGKDGRFGALLVQFDSEIDLEAGRA